MRQRFRYALMAIPVITIITQAGLGSWQTRSVAIIQDRMGDVIDVTLHLESQLGFGGLIHNFKNAVLRPDDTDYILRTEINADNALQLIHELEGFAEKLGMSSNLSETKKTVSLYRTRLDDIRNRETSGLSIDELDSSIRIDDEPALKEIERFQSVLLAKLRSSVSNIQIRSQVITVIITILALLGGYVIFLMARHEQRRITQRDKAAHDKLLVQSHSHAANLERVNTSLQQFAGIAAHDLRAPTRQVLAFAELALEQDNPPEDQKEFLNAIRTSAIRMRNMVETLLGFAQKGFRNPERKTIIPAEIISSLATDKQRSDTQIKLTDLPDLYADYELMERVFFNLISNAEKYCAPDKPCEIIIDGWETEDRVYISVTDNGPGIDPAYAEIIFRPFKRISHEDTQGEGIGLSLVQSIINAHWGEIQLDTGYNGGGARFVFWLPSRQFITKSA